MNNIYYFEAPSLELLEASLPEFGSMNYIVDDLGKDTVDADGLVIEPKPTPENPIETRSTVAFIDVRDKDGILMFTHRADIKVGVMTKTEAEYDTDGKETKPAVLSDKVSANIQCLADFWKDHKYRIPAPKYPKWSFQ